MGVKPASRNPWLMLAIASLSNLALYVIIFGVPPIITRLVSEMGITHEQAGLLMTVSLLTYCLGSVLGGFLSDTFGAKRVVASGLLLASLAGYFFTRTDSFPLMVALRMLVGLGAACVFAPGLKFILASLPREVSGMGMGWYMISINAGVAAPLLVTPLMMASYGWEAPLQLYGLFGALVALLFWWLAREAAPTAPVRPSQPGGSEGQAGRFWSLPLILVSVASLLRMSQTYGVLTWIPPFLTETLRFSPAEVATAATILSLSNVPALLFAGWLSDKIQQKVTLAIIGLLLSSSAVMLAWLETAPFWPVTALMFMIGFGSGISSVPIFALPALSVHRSQVGRATGFASTITFAGPIFTAYLGGYVVTATGEYSLAFLAFGLVTLVAAAVLLPLVRSFTPRW